MKYTVHASFENPNKDKSAAIFSSKLDYATEEEAEQELEKWTAQAKYPFIWIEKSNK